MTTICLHQTGVPKKYISERASAEVQLIYKCMHPGCPYSTAQFAQCCTHICRNTWVCALNVDYVTTAVLGLWT